MPSTIIKTGYKLLGEDNGFIIYNISKKRRDIMKKTNNKGFSLVELIIVIAIMAILAGAIAPALIRYIDKSRKSNDVSSAKTIKTAVETALGNETIYEYLTCATDKANGVLIEIIPGKKTSTEATTSKAADCIKVSGVDSANYTAPEGKNAADVLLMAQEEIATNIGESTPKLKFKKAANDSTTKLPESFYAVVSPKGSVYVFIAEDGVANSKALMEGMTSEGIYQLCPTLCDEYQ